MKFTKILFPFTLALIAFKSKAQGFENITYKRWRIFMGNSLYRPANTKPVYGQYHISTLPVSGFRIGWEYYFKKDSDLQYFTGVNMNFIPLENYNYQLPGKELGLQEETYHDNTFRQIREKHNALSIPIGFLYKFSKKYKNNYHIKGGVNFDLIQYGQFGKTYEITNKNGATKQYLRVEMFSMNNNFIYPSAFLGFGFDYHTRWANLHFTLNCQKSILPYMKGNYKFYNLEESGDSYGTYKLWGDYIGLDIGITLKKFKST